MNLNGSLISILTFLERSRCEKRRSIFAPCLLILYCTSCFKSAIVFQALITKFFLEIYRTAHNSSVLEKFRQIFLIYFHTQRKSLSFILFLLPSTIFLKNIFYLCLKGDSLNSVTYVL